MLTRRSLIAGAAAGPSVAAVAQAALAAPREPLPVLPAKAEFAPMALTYLDAGATHPLPLGAKASLEAYLGEKTQDGSARPLRVSAQEREMIAAFGTLVGAAPDELCVIQSTTMGENLALLALGLPEAGGRIVTDALHFFGSFYTYGEMGRAGMDVVTLPMEADGRIDMAKMAEAIDDNTKLVAISHVSTVNGFEHDLRAVCDLAHAHGAYVFADIIHGAGTTPIDLRKAGVDFAASASYKWLMGDFGLAFLYVRREVQEKLRRPWWGYHQLAKFQTHVYPHDAPGETVADYEASDDAAGLFAMGAAPWTGVVQLNWSLTWLNRVGVEAIQAWRQPMADAIQTELRGRGYAPLTPQGSRTPLVAFSLKDARAKLAEPMSQASIRLGLSTHRFRVSLAVFNDMNDVDKLLSVLPPTPPA
ncbi:MAG: aminotransferase class V-fold PLP-dependent enzyme [Phenylobacterium sp.]|uniref:aminotransferase class V-fold PLP-dependent enzyme n=1 Tax=Phenylobacterium sp. TaxID=1871053 RepID=UPI00271E34C3|nr:aminotransferase class V-fold PLP-dependent enzyme [Phenylobacterium sp.]MDO8901644.1 aminotransferase class V-fold PLP-dependent enzyme [Phenylobacterium sp.]